LVYRRNRNQHTLVLSFYARIAVQKGKAAIVSMEMGTLMLSFSAKLQNSGRFEDC
jgi:hypothetical protein